MKKTATLISALALCVWSQATVAQSLIDGQVTKVDASAGNITIKHGPIRKLDMDHGMTMVFHAQDPTLIKAVKAGDKIKFDAEDVNGQLTVTKIEKAK
ncbi:MAG TPA: copper-binding protein [Xanthobacteraceae bacterium]|jgi:Cu/Ag efflux protein CusF